MSVNENYNELPSLQGEKKPKHLTSELTSAELAILAAGVALEEKAQDVRPLDLSDISDIADSFVIASATSDRHGRNIAEKIRLSLKEHGEVPLNGAQFLKNNPDSSEWIILDYGHLVVHVFFEPMRQFYKLDELWSEAKELELDPELEEIAQRQKTGIYSHLK